MNVEAGKAQEKVRCPWCGESDIYIRYHDEEWGVPCYDDIRLFELLVLEGAQAGLSWITVLKRREAYREAFGGFDPKAVASYDDEKIAELLENPGIIRNRTKILSAVNNAGRFLEVAGEFSSFSSYIWSFVGGKPVINDFSFGDTIPAETAESRAMSRDLKKRGFSFVGPVICYAYMQAAGMVNDHYTECWTRSGVL